MENLILLINVCLYVSLSQGQPSELGVNCAGIMCSPPSCLDTFIPLGGCCPTCAGPGRSCNYRGKHYKDSQSFKDNCNTCTCTDGAIGCTKKLCLDEKPGSCPSPLIVGACVEDCITDPDCPRTQKCCSNGCGHTCMNSEQGKSCTHNGVQYRNGASFPDDCNTCTCTDGLTSCTKMACPGKPGSCPAQIGGGSCLETCTNDYSCPGDEKCCNNGCGTNCAIPITGGKSCLYNGISYEDGENFMDDCNTCRCVSGNAECTLMACPKIPCFHNGINYNDGETFNDDCNACVCSDGIAQCTMMACPNVKPGLCPIPTSPAVCIERCMTDGGCPGREKCCRNGCSTQCLLPSYDGRPCWHKGETHNDGARFSDYCNVCICNDGIATCTQMTCPGGSCYYKGVEYLNGESFKDDCNTCTCTYGKAECTLMACPKRPCFHNGMNYKHGETFNDDCNACVCSDGIAECTMMACPDVKPGTCPPPSGFGICVDRCTTDLSCPGREKCCRHRCGTHCLLPISGGKQCLYNGVFHNDGERFKDDCNVCTCNDGTATCTQMTCPGVKPGDCPPPIAVGSCLESCRADLECPGAEKCCSNGCGRICLPPRNPGLPCMHKGIRYNEGESFMDDCNTCTCSNGNAACTLMACPDVKLGTCPAPVGAAGTCFDECLNDKNCPGAEKCCSNGCGSVCMTPEFGGRPCTHNGITYNDGETFKDDCNTCRCSNGNAACTLMACPNTPCMYKGVRYNHGETFQDDCNTCTCHDGRTACTSKACRTHCIYNGIKYYDGESFQDNCNTCTCTDGRASCTQMACPGTDCLYKGINYKHGQTFKDECNTCTCNDGRAACTLMACPEEKPGRCPPPIGIGICVDRCTTDLSCRGIMKCCSNGCGTDCIIPIKGRTCFHKGIEYDDGERFNDDCNTCRCNNGHASCTKRACADSKPGTCPIPVDGGICVEDCSTDTTCPGIQKCCRNGCGHVCMNPDFGGRSCFHNGMNYTDGESFNDDCNTCTCTNGNVGCTLMACPPKKVCYHKGMVHQDGDKFQDDCNTCVCTDGRVQCTYKSCGRSCDHNGISYQDGESFKDNCNTCTCNNGSVACTLMECGGEKPGRCPRPVLFTLCTNRCNGDNSCPGKQKCCNNWCGNTCMDPAGRTDICAEIICPAVECPPAHTPYTPPGQCCQICRPPIGEKPGSCPRYPRGPCFSMCTTDYSCPGQQKCCDNRCGRSCVRPTGLDRCDGIYCPPLRCRVQHTPQGRCCPVCGQGRWQRRGRGRDRRD